MAEKRMLTKKQLRIRRRRRRRRIIFGLEIVVLLILVGGLFIFAKMGKMNFDELNFENIGINTGIQDNEVMRGYTTLAIVGVDVREKDRKDGLSLKKARSDVMMIVSINNDTKKVKLVSVYRDTYLRIGEDEEGNGIYNKANEAYVRGGKEQFISMLNTNLDLNVTDMVAVDFSAVTEVVDLLGGIDMELTEEEIVHLNNLCKETCRETGKEYEAVEQVPGTHHLNGTQTVSYARIRKTAGNDMRRAARQRDVIYKLVEKAKNSDIATLNNVVDEVFPMIYTTLSKVDILKMGMSMLSYDIEDQAGYPFDHLYGETVKTALDGLDCVVPVTLESNAIRLHEFLYPEDSYVPSEELKSYNQRIIEKGGFDDSDRLEHSEDGSMEAYRQAHQEELQ